MNKSFQIIRTNPRLTTNVKLVIDTNYDLYLESFNSDKELSDEKYKHKILNTKAMFEDEIPKFYDKLPKKIAFSPKDNDDVDVMYDKYENQFDNEYYSGANEVEDQWYSEEFEYFAPLYLQKNNIPKKFIILRVDNPAIYELKENTYTIGKLTKDNFRNEILDKWKCVKLIDLTENTNLGQFINRNINDNNRFPEFSFFFDTKKYNYSKWSGMDYKSGIYTTKELYINDKLFYENNHFNFEQFITKGYETNEIIYPFIWNLKFLFDDDPATPTKFNKYSSNRYFGFYLEDMELVKTLTSYKLEDLKTHLTIKNNIFFKNNIIANPFVNELITEGWAKVNNDIYKIKRLANLQYQIYSKEDLTGTVTDFNENICTITHNNVTNKNYITNVGTIDSYINITGGTEDIYADLYLIEIDDIFHVLKKDSDYYIQSDYAINSNFKELHYWKGGLNNKYDIRKPIIDGDNPPLTYKIYRIKFSKIKDFDFDRIDTKYADFDYEKYTYFHTPEVKLYANEYLDETIPIRKRTHDISYDGQYNLMNISSEYIADDEAFEIQKLQKYGNLNSLWSKNQSICKWGYNGSISHSDYIYKLNNSNEYGGNFNRTTNTNIKKSIVKEKSLDYFYRIGEFYEETINTKKYYLNQTTNIQTDLHKKWDTNNDSRFNLEYYMDSNFDYFDFFFNNIMYYDNNGIKYEKPYLKYSIFSGGDSELPATSLFKGIEYDIFSIDNMTFNINDDGTETLKNVITSNGKFYNDYKMAVILSENYANYNFDGDYEAGYTLSTTNPYNGNENKSISNSSKLESTNQNGIHIILNEKYKNLLIIININIAINKDWESLNNITYFKENHGLYNGRTYDNKYNIFPGTLSTAKIYNPDNLTANYYINSINYVNNLNVYDIPIIYYYIDENGNKGQVNMSNFVDGKNTIKKIADSSSGTWNKKYPPFYVKLNTSSEIRLKKKSYITTSIRGPEYNIYDKYLVYSNRRPLGDSYIRDPLAREINIYKKDDTNKKIRGRTRPKNYKTINRFDGYYEPVFNDINMFRPTYYWFNTGTTKYQSFTTNYKFSDDLEQFGKIDELMYSKVSENGNYLKLRNQDTDKSIYPMIDEIGLSQTERNILLSSWDKEFYIKTLNQQTLLDDYVEIPEFLVIYQPAAEITDTKSVGNLHQNDINYYGFDYIQDHLELDYGEDLTFEVTVKNLSEGPQTYQIGVIFVSEEFGPEQEFTDRISGTFDPAGEENDDRIITITFNKPHKKGNSNFEFTKWEIKFTVWDQDNPIVSNQDNFFNTFNDRNNYSLSIVDDNEYPITALHYIDNVSYSFFTTINSTIIPDNNKMTFTSKFYQWQYWEDYDVSSINGYDRIEIAENMGDIYISSKSYKHTYTSIVLRNNPVTETGSDLNIIYDTKLEIELIREMTIELDTITTTYTSELIIVEVLQQDDAPDVFFILPDPSIEISDIDI